MLVSNEIVMSENSKSTQTEPTMKDCSTQTTVQIYNSQGTQVEISYIDKSTNTTETINSEFIYDNDLSDESEMDDTDSLDTSFYLSQEEDDTEDSETETENRLLDQLLLYFGLH